LTLSKRIFSFEIESRQEDSLLKHQAVVGSEQEPLEYLFGQDNELEIPVNEGLLDVDVCSQPLKHLLSCNDHLNLIDDSLLKHLGRRNGDCLFLEFR
jgi:hypothetical protein